MNCPNLNNPDNKKVIEAFGEDSFWRIFTENNGIIPEFVYEQANKSVIPITQIKPGVQELFESNPELANQVYEALGFKEKSKERNNAFAETMESIEGAKTEERISLHKIFPHIAEAFVTKTKDNKYYVEHTEDLFTNQELKDYLLDRFKPTEKVTDVRYLGITPEQKQQALQLYSQYLDTIFPDSAVKDIVYHDGGKGKLKEEGFKKDFIGMSDGGVLGDGFYFYLDRLKRYDENRSNTEAVILNAKNLSTRLDIIDSSSLSGQRGIGVYEKALTELSGIPHDSYVRGKLSGKYIGNYSKQLSKIGIDSVKAPKEIMVLEPEQIHILGNKQDIEGFREFVNNKPLFNDVKGFSNLSNARKKAAKPGPATKNELESRKKRLEKEFPGLMFNPIFKYVNTEGRTASFEIKIKEGYVSLGNDVYLSQKNFTINSVLKFLKSNSKTAKLTRILESKISVTPEIKVVSSYYAQRDFNAKEEFNAFYDPNTHTIVINSDKIFSNEDFANILLEEMIHAQTAQYLRAGGDKAKAFINLFEKNRAVIQNVTGMQFERELANADEFLAALFYNQDFRETLKQIPSPKTTGQLIMNFFEGLLKDLAELFGIRASDAQTLFADALIAGWDVIQDSNNFLVQTVPQEFEKIELLYNDAKQASYYGDQLSTYEERTGKQPTLQMKETAQNLINRAKLVSFDSINHVYKYAGKELKSVSKFVEDSDPKMYGKNDTDVDEKFPNNRIWGNQVDELLRKVILGLPKDKALNEMRVTPGLLLSEGVIDSLYDHFTEFLQSYPDSIFLSQQILYNTYAGVAGTADVVVIFPDGRIKIVDLKSSIYPVGYKDGVYESYTTLSGKTNSYNSVYGSFASRKQKVEAQLSSYKGLAESMDAKFDPENAISVLPVQVIQDTKNTNIISSVNPEPELNTLNSLSKFVDVLKRTSDAPIKETERATNAINALTKSVKLRFDYLEKKGIKKQEYWKLKNLLDSGLPTLENVLKINRFIDTMYNFMVKDLEKGFSSIGEQFEKFITEIPNLSTEEVTSKFLDYKRMLDTYSPVMQQLKDLYVDMQVEGDVLPGNETFEKLEMVTNTFSRIKNKYNDNIHKILAKNLGEEVNPELKGRLEESLSKIKKRYDSLPDKKTMLAKELAKRIKTLEESIERNTSPEGLIEEISKGSSKDISMIDFLITPAISSSNPIIALVAKKVKRAFENARLASRKFAGEVSDEFEKFKKASGYNINSSVMYQGMFEKMTEYKKGNPVTTYAFVQPYDVTAYEKAKQKMYEDMKSAATYLEKQIISTRFYKENTVPLRENDLVVNGVTIIKGQKTLIAEKQNLVDTGIWSQKEFDSWLNINIKKNKETGEITYTRDFSEPSPKYKNNRFEELINGKDAKSEYFKFLLSRYFKSQERVPIKRGFKLPAITKSTGDFLLEDPKQYLKFKKDRLLKRGKEEEDVAVDSVKAIPVLYSFDIPTEETSLDLTSSILEYDYMTLKYEASNSVLGVAESTLDAVRAAGVYETDSLGRKIEDRVAKSIGIDNWNKYVKKNGDSNTAALLEAFIDMQLYNLRKAKEEVAPFGFKMDLGKMADNLMGFGSITQIGGNPLLSVANSLQANTQMLIESASKEFFTDKSIAWAKAKYYSSLDEFTKDMGSPVARSFMGQLIEIYDPLQGEYTDKYGNKISKNQFLRLFNTDMWFAMQQMGEHAAAVQSMLALMYETKLRDNKGKEINLFEAYELNNAGKISLKQGVELKGNLSEDKLVSFDFQNRLHAINKRLHGVYNSFDAPTLSRYSIGRLALMYRKHVGPGFKKRFKGWSVDQELGGETEGFYISFYKAVFMQPLEILKEISPIGKSNLTPLEQANVRRALREQLIIMLTGTAAWLLTEMMKEMDDDEKKKYAHLLYWTLRLNQEASAYGGLGDPRTGFILPPLYDMFKSFKSPTAAYGTLERGFKFLNQLFNPFEEYERNTGIWEKGDLKIYSKFLKLLGITGNTINPDEAIDIMQMQSK